MKAFLGKGKKIPEPFPEPFTTALNRHTSGQLFHVVRGGKERKKNRPTQPPTPAPFLL
jgi:hypothetical protein